MTMNYLQPATSDSSIQSQKLGRQIPWLGIILGLIGLLLVAVIGFFFFRINDVPANLDLATTRWSAQGLYQATIVPDTQPIPVNRIHTWVLHVESAEGQPLDDADITLDGDMPQHGHGMPTHPLVTQNLGNGDYLVEGMKFQMGGWWVIDFDISAAGVSDRVSFNLILQE
jgi:hypothetical protein